MTTPIEPSIPVSQEKPVAPEVSATPKQLTDKAKTELPNTGTEANASLASLGLLGLLSGFGLVARKKKED